MLKTRDRLFGGDSETHANSSNTNSGEEDRPPSPLAILAWVLVRVLTRLLNLRFALAQRITFAFSCFAYINMHALACCLHVASNRAFYLIKQNKHNMHVVRVR